MPQSKPGYPYDTSQLKQICCRLCSAAELILAYERVHSWYSLGSGKGYYSYADHVVAPTMLSDASDSRRLSAGSWVCADGDYDFSIYAGRPGIDYKEGDAVLRGCETKGDQCSA